MTKWRVNLRQSKDLSLIGELTQAKGKSLQLAINTPGSGNFDYPMRGEWAAAINGWNTCVSYERYNWRATQAMNLLGTPGQVWDWIWSGFVLPIDEDWTGDWMKVACVGWAQRLAYRMLHADKTYTSTDDAPILQDLLAYANAATFAYPDATTYAVPTVAGSSPATPTWMSWGGTLPDSGPGGSPAYTPRASYTMTKQKYQMILSIFDEIVGIENGCDWWVDPKTRAMYAYRLRCANRNVVVAFKWGPNNLGQFSRNIAADQKANYVLVTGNASTQPGFAESVADQNVNGLIESITQWSDCNSNQVLMAEAASQIILRKDGRITYGITPFAYVGDIDREPNAVPEPFVDYDPVGDKVFLKATHPVRGDIPLGAVRSFGCTVNIDDENNEQLGQLQVAP